MNITKCLVQDGEKDDSILHRPLFNVNTRLYKSSANYRILIQDIVCYMLGLLVTRFDGNTKRINGISGANVGIPFNIVATEMQGHAPRVFVNPTIIDTSMSNTIRYERCGSLEHILIPTKVTRPGWLICKYYDLAHDQWITCKFYGLEASVLEHEIDHNQGILITDKE